MNMHPLFFFMVFSGMAMNLALQCGLGVKGIVSSELRIISVLQKLCVIFVTSLILWIILSWIVNYFHGELFVYILLFPLCSISYDGIEYLFYRFVFKTENAKDAYISFCPGISAAALFISLVYANTFPETFVILLGFAAGIFICALFLGEIRRKAVLEAVPQFLRGIPLMIISMGLLALISASAAVMLFNIYRG